MYMKEKVLNTRCGNICYYINNFVDNRLTLVLLPGLTADHRLFDKQIDFFNDKYNVLTWDGPGHNNSRPFSFDFDMFDKAKWLNEIFDKENIVKPVIIGQSMGAYEGQAYQELFKDKLAGFIVIDSAPLQRKYITSIEIWLLERMEPVYRLYPWKTLIKQGSNGVATSKYGRKLMAEMMSTYDHKYYAKLAGHGYNMLAKCYKANLEYKITCPVILICGKQDKAGSTKSYNLRWHKDTDIPLYMVDDAGHNSNSDKPEEINSIIENFILSL